MDLVEAASTFVSAPDGLRLYARSYGRRSAPAAPSASGRGPHGGGFRDAGRGLAGDANRPRRVIALDYRGRGQSEYDKIPLIIISRSSSPTCSP